MKIETEDISEGLLNGKIVWVCDLRFNDYANKPIRSIKPTMVLVRDNSEVSKSIYYSNSHFVTLGKNDKPTSKIIALFDNTGYRSFTGVSLNCFDSEAECKTFYAEQLKTAINGLNEYKKSTNSQVDKVIKELSEL